MQIKGTEEIEKFLEPIASEMGLEILEAKWTGRDKKSLTVYVDAPGGVDLVALEKFHRAIDEPLDELDPTFGVPYTLNCSSAGLDRAFKTERDYLRHMGEEVELHLYAAENGKKLYTGKLLSYDKENVVIQTESGEKSFPISKIAKACLYIEV